MTRRVERAARDLTVDGPELARGVGEVTDPRVRAWFADPARVVPSRVEERPMLAAMALTEVRELVPDARLVVLVAAEDAADRWGEALRSLGLRVGVDAWDGPCDAVVLVPERHELAELEGSPREVWVDEGTLDFPLEPSARGAWRLLLMDPELCPPMGLPSAPPPGRALSQRWFAQVLAPRPLQHGDDAHVLRAAHQLRVSRDAVRGAMELLGSTDAMLLMAALEASADPTCPLTDADGAGPPRRTDADLGDDWLEVFVDAAFVAVVDDVRVFVMVTPANDTQWLVRLYCADESPSALLRHARNRGWSELNPYRRQVVQVLASPSDQKTGELSGLALRGVATPNAPRSELLLDDDLWTELDANVTGLFRRAPLLERLGLGTTRGVLLEGPPGVGKTHARFDRILTPGY